MNGKAVKLAGIGSEEGVCIVVGEHPDAGVFTEEEAKEMVWALERGLGELERKRGEGEAVKE